MSKKLLVTGGAGFIGSNFILYWLEKHPQDIIVNIDLLTYAGNLANLEKANNNSHYSFVQGDINDQDLIIELIKKNQIDTIIHFAAESHVDRSILEPDAFIRTNINGTFSLLQAALTTKIKHFHHISTDEVFGSLPLHSQEKFTLQTCYDPRSPYSASKASSDHLVRAYGETYNLPYTISNCSNNYGPYQFPEKLFGLAITNLLENKKVPIYGAGENVRDWLYVEDHCRAIEAILNNGPTKETFLIGGLTEDISNLSIVRQIITLMGKNPDDEIEFVKDRPGHDLRYAIDWSETKSKLNWQPQMTLQTGLEQTISFYRNNPSWWQPLKQGSTQFFNKNYHSLNEKK